MIQSYMNELRTYLKLRSTLVAIGVYLVGLYLGLLALSSGADFLTAAPEAAGMTQVVGFDLYIWLASFSHYFLCAIFILTVAPEWAHRTFKQRVINGESKLSCLASKAAFSITILIAGILLINAFAAFEGAMESLSLSDVIIPNLKYLAQGIGFLALAACVLFYVKSGAAAIVAFLFYVVLGEGVLGYALKKYLSPEVEKFLPAQILSSLVPNPFSEAQPGSLTANSYLLEFMPALCVIAILWTATFIIFRFQELK